MHDYEEELCYEPSLADGIMLEYQQKMKDVLLRSIKQDIEGIKSENERLKEKNEKLQELVYGIQQRENSLEIEKSQFQRKLRRERLSELMGDFEVLMYQADGGSVKIPKCGNCNENRKIEFISPLGRKTNEPCTCDVSKVVYSVKKSRCCEFRIDSDGNSMLMWYKIKEDRNSELARYAYKEGTTFEELETSSYNTFFKSKDDCQKYCDWLNSKEAS